MRILKSFKLTALFLISLLVVSCSPKKDGLLTIDTLNLGEENFSLSLLSDNIEYITFGNDVLFTESVGDYFITDSEIILSTKSGVLRFDRDGGFLGRIGSRGRGPEEYVSIPKLTVDIYGSEVYVLDSKKIVVYGMDGRFLRSMPISASQNAQGIKMLSKHIFLQCENRGADRYFWLITDTMGNIVSAKLNPIPPGRVIIGPESYSYKLGENIYYWNMYCDTVFMVSPDMGHKPVMLLTNIELMDPDNYDLTNLRPGQIVEFMRVTLLFETSKFVVMYVLPDGFQKDQAFSILDKRNGKKYISNTGVGIPNDIDCGPDFRPLNGCFEEDGAEYLVSFVDAYTIKSWANSEEFRSGVAKFPDKKKKYEELANSLEDTDNPVLMLVKLK